MGGAVTRPAGAILLNVKDYTIESYLSEGAMGKVYLATRKADGKKVAMKFFGYTHCTPVHEEIQREIELMFAVAGTDGVLETHGYFMDSVDGYISGKIHKDGRYPVIVMELLDGGHMLDRINKRNVVSEKFISRAFRSIVLALRSLHSKGYIHRDLKLENVMLATKDEDSPVKIIDFGLMVRLKDSLCRSGLQTGVYQDRKRQGTPGFVAPESLTDMQYSSASDVWQAGCVLYSLLSGTAAFNPNIPEQITQMSYFKMVGKAWDNISSSAKDLVSKLLKRDPRSRITISEILQHPWLDGDAPDVNLGDSYFERIRHLALRHRLKAFFVDNKIEQGNKERRKHLHQLLPVLATPASPVISRDHSGNHTSLSPIRIPSPAVSDNESATNTPTAEDAEKFRGKLKSLKRAVVRSVSKNQNLLKSNVDSFDAEDGKEDNWNTSLGNVPLEAGASGQKRIDYKTFGNMLRKCGLPELCNPEVFHIFDMKGCGTIDLKEFLMTLLAFNQGCGTDDTPDESAAKLFFDMFVSRKY